MRDINIRPQHIRTYHCMLITVLPCDWLEVPGEHIAPANSNQSHVSNDYVEALEFLMVLSSNLVAIVIDGQQTTNAGVKYWIAYEQHKLPVKDGLYHLMNWYHYIWLCNERDGVSNHRRLDGMLNRLFRHRSKKTSKLRVTGLCEGNSPLTGEFPS